MKRERYRDIVIKYHLTTQDVSRIRAKWKKMLAIAESKNTKVCAEWKTFAGFLTWSLSNSYGKANNLRIRKDDVSGAKPETCIWAKKNMKNKESTTTLGLAFRDHFENRYIYKHRGQYMVFVKRMVDGKRKTIFFGEYLSLTVAKRVRDYAEKEFDMLANKSTKERVGIIKNVFGITGRKVKLTKTTYIRANKDRYVITVPINNHTSTLSLSINPNNFYGKKINKSSVVAIRDFIVDKVMNNKAYSREDLIKDLKKMTII